MEDHEWTLEMLVGKLLETDGNLTRHVLGCEESQQANTATINAMSKKLDEIWGVWKGGKRIVAAGSAGIGKVALAVLAAVCASVVAVAVQNYYLHQQTADRVEATARQLANETTASNEVTIAAIKSTQAREQAILDLLKKKHH